MGFGRVQTFVGHAIDAYQMRFMALREHSRMTTYMFAHRRGIEENRDISPDRHQGLRPSGSRLSSIRTAAC